MDTPVLSVRDVNTFYGGIHALRGISLDVGQGEIVALIGGNGAGKSTTLNTISGLVRQRSGQVLLNGEDLSRFPAHEIMAKGVVQVPEGRRIFARLTVLENLRMGAYTRSNKDELEPDFERVFALFPRLRERISQPGGTLSGGEQQMLAIGRALMSHPKLLLLDEPSMGLAPILVEQIFDVIRDIHAQGTTVLLVEQNALMALGIANRGYILQTGRIVLEDTAANLRQNPEVQKAYLGG
jgi:branched-chain amino acid transport system ATP-binding protein